MSAQPEFEPHFPSYTEAQNSGPPDPVCLKGGLCGARKHSFRAEPVLPRGHLRLVALKSSPETQGLSFVDREDLVPLSF